tara:strand:+ start:859 stop:1170 length:312 start_codon:yes stop_codon:yes gene_type:complete
METNIKQKEKKLSNLMIDESNIQDLIHTLSHYEIHTIVVALYNAARIIDMMDPNRSFKIDNDMLANQSKYDAIEMTLSLIDQAMTMYHECKLDIDQKFQSHIN